MNTLEAKQERYNVLVSSILTNKATIGKGLWDMGLALKEVKERDLYLLEFRDFNEFLENKVEIGKSTAHRCIAITTEFTLRDFMKWGIKQLEIIKREFPKETDRKDFTQEEFSHGRSQLEPQISDYKLDKGIPEITRFKTQVGIKSPDIQETELKLIRQYSKIEAFLEDLISSLANWIVSAKKHSQNEEIRGLVVKAEELSKRFK